MPWLPEAKKDVTSCEKPRSGANARDEARMSEWGNPPGEEPGTAACAAGPTRGTETSQYPEEKKANAIAPVVASESAPAQTGRVLMGRGPGLKGGRRRGKGRLAESAGKRTRRG